MHSSIKYFKLLFLNIYNCANYALFCKSGHIYEPCFTIILDDYLCINASHVLTIGTWQDTSEALHIVWPIFVCNMQGLHVLHTTSI